MKHPKGMFLAVTLLYLISCDHKSVTPNLEADVILAPGTGIGQIRHYSGGEWISSTLFGEVKNVGEATAHGVSIQIIIRDDENQIVCAGFGYCEPSTILVNRTATFNIENADVYRSPTYINDPEYTIDWN